MLCYRNGYFWVIFYSSSITKKKIDNWPPLILANQTLSLNITLPKIFWFPRHFGGKSIGKAIIKYFIH